MVTTNNKALGIIFPNTYDNWVPELVNVRLMASIPFASRYRMIDFILSSMANSNISKEQFENYMMATGEMATDVGTILYGKEAVASGLIDKLGGLNDALSALHKMIEKQREKSLKD